MNREELISGLNESGGFCDDTCGGGDLYIEAATMLRADAETIEMLAEHLDCMIDYVCESSAWRMVGAQNALREARDALDALAALKENNDGN